MTNRTTPAVVAREGFASAEELTVLQDFDSAWRLTSHGAQFREIRKVAERLHTRFASGPKVVAVRTLPISTLAYPTKYAFWSAAFSPAPYVIMKHQALLVQFMQKGQLKTLLFNPTDAIAARRTPFFARLIEQAGDFVAFNILGKSFTPLDQQLRQFDLEPKDIDYVAFDHFHTQDLRPLMGTENRDHSAHFPRAKLLAPRAEWDDWAELHPMQRAWFVADGRQDLRHNNVVLTQGDFQLGDGIMLLRTPGHTSGNQTLLINTDDGVWGCSENGTCADNWAPHESRIPGLAKACRMADVDLLLNANTPELGSVQYNSMVLEKTLTSRVARAPGFCQMFPSSEVIPSMIAPGLKPTVQHGSLRYGQVLKPRQADSRGRATSAAATPEAINENPTLP